MTASSTSASRCRATSPTCTSRARSGPLWWARLQRHGARPPGVRACCDRCTRDEHLPEDHGDVRRTGVLVQPRRRSASPAPRATQISAARQRAPLLLSRAPRTAAAPAASISATAARAGCMLPAIRIPRARPLRALFVRAGRLGRRRARRRRRACYPRVTDGTLVAATRRRWAGRTSRTRRKPDGVMNSVLDYDYGPGFNYNDVSGMIDQRAAAGQAGDPDARAEGRRRRQRDRRHPVACCSRLPLGTYTRLEPVRERRPEGPGASLAGGYDPVREDEGRARRQRRPAPVARGALRRPVAATTSASSGGEHRWSQQGFLLPDDANRLINQLLNDMLRNELLPKRGEFMPGFAPKPLAVGADVPPVQLVEPMAH